MVLFNDKFEMKEKDFENYFEVGESDTEILLMQKDYMERNLWLKVLELVKSWDGKFAQQPRRFVIPKPNKIEPKVIPIAEIMPPSQNEGLAPHIVTMDAPETPKIKMPPESEGTMRLEDLTASESDVGQIFPVIKDQFGNILDGFHRKRVNPNWKETTIEVTDPIQALRIRVHANILRRNIRWAEKHKWVIDARKLLNPESPQDVSVRELATVLGMGKTWVAEHDRKPCPLSGHDHWKERFLGYNVWGFKNEDWRKEIAPAPTTMPDTEFYHGTTPPFVIHQLIKMFQPKTILDSMAGVGTTGYVCAEYDGLECDLFDLYPYPKFNVKEADAEFVDTGKKYDLIFNHIPYWQMVKYGDKPNDLSTLKNTEFFGKLQRIFKHNHELLKDNGIYAVLVGDWRHKAELQPLIAKATHIGIETGFRLIDEAVTITSGHKGRRLQEYRAAEHGYLAQTFDIVLIFRKVFNR